MGRSQWGGHGEELTVGRTWWGGRSREGMVVGKRVFDSGSMWLLPSHTIAEQKIVSGSSLQSLSNAPQPLQTMLPSLRDQGFKHTSL